MSITPAYGGIGETLRLVTIAKMALHGHGDAAEVSNTGGRHPVKADAYTDQRGTVLV